MLLTSRFTLTGHPVPIEVIEWQPSYAQRGAIGISGGEWNPNWEATQSSKCAYLVNRLHEIGAVKDRAGNLSPKTKAIVFSQFWRHHKLIERTLLESGIKFSILWKSLDPKWGVTRYIIQISEMDSSIFLTGDEITSWLLLYSVGFGSLGDWTVGVGVWIWIACDMAQWVHCHWQSRGNNDMTETKSWGWIGLNSCSLNHCRWHVGWLLGSISWGQVISFQGCNVQEEGW